MPACADVSHPATIARQAHSAAIDKTKAMILSFSRFATVRGNLLTSAPHLCNQFAQLAFIGHVSPSAL
jgi:hypothetical protein